MTGLSPIDCGSGSPVITSLAPGDSQSCTATYTTTKKDLAAGSITNVGTATGTTPAGSTVRYNSSVTIPEKGKPFTCNNPVSTAEYFLSQSTGATGPTRLYHAYIAGSPPSFIYAQYTPSYLGAYNAIGFDSATNYIYGIVMGSAQMIRIDSSGTPGAYATVTGLPAMPNGPIVGAFDPSGNYWVAEGYGSTVAAEITGTGSGSPAATPVTLSRGYKAADWTYSQGYLWGLANDKIFRVTIPGSPAGSGPLYTVKIYPLGTYSSPLFSVQPGTYGAAFTWGNGDLGFSNNTTGTVYDIQVSTPVTPTFALAATYAGPGSVQLNDGTACDGAVTDLGVTTAGPATVPAGGTVTWNVTVTNNGPGNSSGFVVDDTTTGGISNVTTSTPGCTVSAATGAVQCEEGTLDNGDPFTITLSGTAPATGGACVVNTATVTANETDPNSGNNTSSLQTCTTTGPGDIFTVAGDGAGGFSGDGGPATSAELFDPQGVSSDGAGNLLIADTINNVIRVVAGNTGTFYGQAMTAGDIYTIAGDGTAGYTGDGGSAITAELNGPTDVMSDSSGNLLIADTTNNVIRVVAGNTGTFYRQAMTAGDIYTIAGDGTRGYAGDGGLATNAELNVPWGVTPDGPGDLLIADTGNSRIREVTD